MTLPALLALSVAFAAPPVHLDDALRAALAHDPTLAAAGIRTKAREAAVVSARGAFDLVLELQLDADTERQTGAFPGSEPEPLNTTNLAAEAAVVQPLVWGTRLRLGLGHTVTATDNPFRNCIPGQASDQCHQTRLELAVQQPLLRGFGRDVNEAGVRAARAAVDAGQARRQAAAEQVLESVVVAFVELAYAQEDWAIRQGAVELAERQLEATEARIDAGRAAPVDLAVVRQTLAERRRAEHAASRLAEDRAATLAVLMGVEAPPEVAGLPEPAPWSGDAAAAAEAAAAGPELRAAERDVAARAETLALDADAVRPQLDLRLVAAQIGLDETAGEAIAAVPGNETHYYGASLIFAWPPANRAAEGAAREARLEVEAARLDLEARKREARRVAAEALRATRAADRQTELAREAVAAAEASHEAEQQKYALGRSTNLAVLQVQQALAEARLALARARADRLVAAARLRRLTGDLLTHHGLTVE